MKRYIEQRWYSKSPIWWLLPLTLLFVLISRLRKRLYRWKLLSSQSVKPPVIVVGNISIGGAGKTPLVLWLVNFLQQQGYRPGVISRGYGGNFDGEMALLPDVPSPMIYGDEPSLIRLRAGVPVAIASERAMAANAIAEQGCDIVIADDGLQHYALERDVEIAVVDAQRALGNEYCLPAGPLRESKARLEEVDWVIGNGGPVLTSLHYMTLVLGQAVNLLSADTRPLSEFSRVYAIAGIGNPQRFFEALSEAGLSAAADAFDDHYQYTLEDLEPYLGDTPLLMTEKDAVKCRPLLEGNSRANNVWYVPVTAELNPEFSNQLMTKLKALV